MQFPVLLQDANYLWLCFTIYFLTKYRPVSVRRNDIVSIFSLERLAVLLGIPLLFFPRTHFGLLAIRIHANYALALAGFILVIAGLAFSAWARDFLGRNWSGRVIIQNGHQLVTAGPYAYVRHPLYTGLIVAMVGTALVTADIGAVLGFVFVLLFIVFKAEREERLLETEFGPAYATYRQRTGGLLPRCAHV
jgi:protein-S-isoprenylcysteine O-methyltransferase Ste14